MGTHRGDSNEYPKHMFLWRTDKNYPSIIIKWAASWQNQQCGCAPSEDSDQPGHLPSLIRVFAVRMKKLHTERTAKTLIRLGGCPGWSESLLGAQPHCWFCHEAAQIPSLSVLLCSFLLKVKTGMFLSKLPVARDWVCQTRLTKVVAKWWMLSNICTWEASINIVWVTIL